MDIVWKHTWRPLIFLLLFVEAMLSVSFFIRNPEILFPEASALAIGCWVFKEERWSKNHRLICIMPTLSAGLAIGLGSLSISVAMRESAALVLVVLILHVSKCSIGPSISAAILPLVLGIHSWDYVISVFVLTFVIMLGASKYNVGQVTLHPIEKQTVRKVVYSVIIIALIALCYSLKLKIGIIPPLLVVAYEWFNKTDLSRLSTFRQTLLLTFAALAGAEFHRLFPQLTTLAGLLSIMITILFMRLLKAKLPPALAISLLPLILGDVPVWEFPLIVLVESWFLSEMAVCYLRLEPRFSITLFKHSFSK